MSRFYSHYYYNKQKLNCKIIMNIFENLTAFPQFRVIFTLKKQDYSCSTVSLHKPCSVLQWSGSHLSAFFQTPHRMISLHLQQVPLPNLGFSLAGFIAFHFPDVPGNSVTVTLLQTSAIVQTNLRVSSAVSLAAARSY